MLKPCDTECSCGCRRCNSGPRARDCCPPAGPSMGQQFIVTMNPATSGKSSTRSSGYHQKALAEIRNSLLPFANIGNLGENLGSSAASTISTLSTTSGISSASGHSGISAASGSNGIEKDLTLLRQTLVQLMSMGYTEVSFYYLLHTCSQGGAGIAMCWTAWV